MLVASIQLLQSTHKDSDHTAVMAVLRCAETHPCGNVMGTVIMLCLCFGCHGSLELDSMVITTCALIGTSRKLAVHNYMSIDNI